MVRRCPEESSALNQSGCSTPALPCWKGVLTSCAEYSLRALLDHTEARLPGEEQLGALHWVWAGPK